MMDILKLKNEDGTWTSVPAIQGKDGTNGTDGKDGTNGTNGTNGISPTATVTQTTTGATVTITDTNGTTTAEIKNGKDGSEADVPIATVDAVGKVKPDGTTITVDADGTISSAGGGGGSGLPIYIMEAEWQGDIPPTVKDKEMLKKFYKERFVDKVATFELAFPTPSGSTLLYPCAVENNKRYNTPTRVDFYVYVIDGLQRRTYRKNYIYNPTTDTIGDYASWDNYPFLLENDFINWRNIEKQINEIDWYNIKGFIGSIRVNDEYRMPIQWFDSFHSILGQMTNKDIYFNTISDNYYADEAYFNFDGNTMTIYDTHNSPIDQNKYVYLYYVAQ